LIGAVKTNALNNVVSAEIYYRHISNLTYEVHLILYRPCVCPTLAATQNGCVTSLSAGIVMPIVFDTTGVNEVQDYVASNLCGASSSSCSSTSSFINGYAKWHYKAIVHLPSQNKDWLFSWSNYSRDFTVNNIAYSTGQFTVEASLNNITKINNSTPYCTMAPLFDVCGYGPYSQVRSYLYDADADSIYAELAQPLAANGNCGIKSLVSFFAPSYTIVEPFGLFASFSLNKETGNALFNPSIDGTFSIPIKNWDIDKLTGDTLGSSMRESLINIFSTCGPMCFGSYGVPLEKYFTVCPNQQISISDTGVGLSLATLISYTSNHNLAAPGSTITSTNAVSYWSQIINFTWTPTDSQIGTHKVIIRYVDTTCNSSVPFTFSYYHTLNIIVKPSVHIKSNKPYCHGGDSIKLEVTGPPGITQFNWSILPGQALSSGATANFSGTIGPIIQAAPTENMYIQVQAQAYILSCAFADTIMLKVDTAIIVQQLNTPYQLCANDSVQLNLVANQTGGTWHWLSSSGLSNSNIPNPVCGAKSSSTYVCKYTSAAGCDKTEIVEVLVKGIRPKITATPEKKIACIDQPFHLIATAAAQACGKSNWASDSVNNKYVLIGNEQNINTECSPLMSDNASAYRYQMLFTAKELNAIGIKEGNINGIFFDIISFTNTTVLDTIHNLSIRMGCTNNKQCSANQGFINDITDVYYNSMYSTFIGTNKFNFKPANAYYWDGQSNLIVELCYSRVANFFSNINNAIIYNSSTDFNSVINTQSFIGNGCLIGNSANYYVGNLRPNTGFIIDTTVNMNFSWQPNSSIIGSSTQQMAIAKGISQATTYTLTAGTGDSSCYSSTTINVSIDSTKVSASSFNSHLCEAGIDSLYATTNFTNMLYECGDNNIQLKGTPQDYEINSIGGLVNTDSSGSVFPFNSFQGTAQFIISAQDLKAILSDGPQQIQALSLDVLAKNTLSFFKDFTLKVACIDSSINELGSFNTKSMTKVYHSSNYSSTVGWNTFPFEKAYLWNGVDNLLVQICFDDYASTQYAYDSIRLTQHLYPSKVYFNCSQYYAWPGCETTITNGTCNGYYSRPVVKLKATSVLQKQAYYNWQPDLFVYNANAALTAMYVKQSTVYTVSALNNNGCNITDSTAVIVSPHAINIVPNDFEICVGDTMQINVISNNTPINYMWQSSLGLSCNNCADPTLQSAILTAGKNYQWWVSSVDQFGCIDSSVLNVYARALPIVKILNPDTIVIVPQFTETVKASGALSYAWYPELFVVNTMDSFATLQANSNGYCYVIGQNEYGCKGKDSIYLYAGNQNPVFIPSAFAPNGDNLNDVFRIRCAVPFTIDFFKVFNRFGQEVFTADANHQGWDGTFQGAKCDIETYFYTTSIKLSSGKRINLQGTVALIR
jgi:gliding motility-associated-like protein